LVLALAVGLAGSLGSVGRYLIDGFVADRTSGPFPFGTLVVNVIGSFVLGALTGVFWYHGLAGSWRSIVGIGFCGGLTTWSAVSWETVRLAETGLPAQAALNVAGGLGLSLVAGAAGIIVVAVL
jgi:fluoride exporter